MKVDAHAADVESIALVDHRRHVQRRDEAVAHRSGGLRLADSGVTEIAIDADCR